MHSKNLLDEFEQLQIDSDEKLDLYVQAHHQRFHNLLFWASLVIVFNFAMLIRKIINLNPGTGSGEILYLQIGLGTVMVAFGLFLGFQWKAESEMGPPEWGRVKILLHYRVSIINKEIGLITAYLAAYSLVLAAAYLFYSLTGLIPREKISAIVSAGTPLVYAICCYFLYHACKRRLKLKRGIKVIETESGQKG